MQTAKLMQGSSNQDRTRVLIVDDHPVFREGLASVLAREPDWVIVGEASCARQVLPAVKNLQPDLVLLDLNLPDQSGLEVVKDLRVLHPALPILIISMHDEVLYAERTLRAGANGFVMKDAGPEKIISAIREVLRGQVYVSPAMSARIINALSDRSVAKRSPIAQLTDREFEIFQLMGEGYDSHAIAQRLGISYKTVNAHRDHIKGKLKLVNGMELICHAVRWVETARHEGADDLPVETGSRLAASR
jgi:DNA-binding NarL/FixJ family response regulator